MTEKKTEPTQREKFEAMAKELEALHGKVPDEELPAILGATGTKVHEGEAEARRKAGLPPASH